MAPVEVERPRAKALVTGELIYLLDLSRSASAGGLLIDLMARDRKKSGEWSKPKTITIDRREIAGLPDAADRSILDAICGAASSYAGWGDHYAGLPVPPSFVLSSTMQRGLVPGLCDTGRFLMRVPPAPAAHRSSETFVRIERDPTPTEFLLRIDRHVRRRVRPRPGRAGTVQRRRPPRSAALVRRRAARLPEAIVRADESLIRDLKREDLELLLS